MIPAGILTNATFAPWPKNSKKSCVSGQHMKWEAGMESRID